MFEYPGQNYTGGFNYPRQPIQQQPQMDERIWVQNATAAESYLLAPNSFVRLWDSSANKFYEKRADATGRPLPMDVYEYKRISSHLEPIFDEANKLSNDEINAKFEEITQRLDRLEKRGAGKNAASKSVSDDTSV